MAQPILASGAGGVKVRLRAPSVSIDMERYLPAGTPLFQLQGTLEQITGIPPAGQTLQIVRPAAAPQTLSDESKTLYDYGVQQGSVLIVQGSAPAWLAAARADIGDDESVPRYEMSQEEYEKRGNTVRAQLAAVRAQQKGHQAEDPPSSTRPSVHPSSPNSDHIKVGGRCEVDRAAGPSRGTVRFVGEATMPPLRPGGKSVSGVWVGVQYDEPVGANDGSVGGRRYFDTLPKYGGFVRPDKVRVGDFPEEDLLDEEDEEI